MAGRLSDATIEEVQRSSDIVEVISSYVPLKRAGKDYKACCPFHNEKTPSFFVSPSKQIFKCFGCGKGGSVFQFIMARENATFPEAVRLLAERAGVVIEESREREPSRGGTDRSRVLKTVAWATQVFQRFLKDGRTGRAAREYLKRRGFTEETIQGFRLGYAPDAWDGLLKAAGKRGVDESLLLAAGLAVPRSEGGGFYDRFRHRVMFPIFDTLNRPIAFGGRTLGDDPAKYLNSPDTVVFDKSRNLYGLTAARDAMTAERRTVVVEGYTDCLMAHQAGLANVVATLGTSLTREHVRLLRRYVDEVVLVFDGDMAGRNAADRAVQIFLEEELTVRIATLPEGVDPCDFLAAGDKDAFVQLLREAPDALEYKWRLVRQGFRDADSVRAQRRAVDAMLEAVAALGGWNRAGDHLKRDLVLARMASVLGVEERSLRERLASVSRQVRSRRDYEGAAPQGEDQDRPARQVRDDLRRRTERLVLQVLLASPDRIAATKERLRPEDVQEDAHREIYETLIAMENRLASEGVAVLWSRLGETAASVAAELVDDEPVQGKCSELLEDGLATLARLGVRDQMAAIRRQMAASNTEEERRAALRRLQDLGKSSQGFLPPGMRSED